MTSFYLKKIRFEFKARLPKTIFLAKAKLIYKGIMNKLPEKLPEDKQLQFSDPWVHGWMVEYGVSLQFANKKFAVSQEDRIIRVIDIYKNLWTVRKFFIDNHGYDPVIINGDQECFVAKNIYLDEIFF